MTFEDLITTTDPSTLAKLTDNDLKLILEDALRNVPPVEERWIQAKLLAKSEKPKPKAKKKQTQSSKKMLEVIDRLKNVSLKDIQKAQEKLEK